MCPPSHRVESRHVHQFARRAIRLGCVEYQLAVETDHLADQFGQFPDRDVLTDAHVYQRRLEPAAHRLVAAQQARIAIVRQVHQEDAGVGHVVAVQELAPWRAGAPDGDRPVAALLRLVELAQQRRDDVTVLRVVVVARSVQIGRHHCQILRAVLAVVAPAHFDAGDLGQRVRAVGRLQRARQQAVLAHRLRRHLRVNAARPEEHQPRHAMLPRAVDNIGLDHQVVADELRRVAVVGDDAADLGSGEEHILGLVFGKEGVGRGRVGQIEFGVRPLEDVRIAFRLEIADDGRADQTAVAGYIDARFEIQDTRVLCRFTVSSNG